MNQAFETPVYHATLKDSFANYEEERAPLS